MRLKLLHDVLSVLRSSQECVTLTSAVGLRTSQIIDQLSATARTFMAFLKLLLDDVLGLGTATHALTALWLRTSYRPPAVTRLCIIRSHALLLRIHLTNVLFIGERVGPELLSLLAGTLLVLIHLLSHLEVVMPGRIHVDPLHARVCHGMRTRSSSLV